MPRPRRSRRVLTIVVLVLASLTLITIDETGSTHHLTSGVKSVASGVFTPVRDAADDVLHPIGDFFAGAFDYGSLQHENDQLRDTIGRLRQAQAERPYENRQLRQMMALDHLPWLGSTGSVLAQTTAAYPSNFADTIDIDKGRGDGVDVGMPVVGAGGLVGQVTQAFHHTAVVTLLVDSNAEVGVTWGPAAGGAVATVAGQGPGDPLTAQFVAPYATLHKGEVMYTNGLGGSEYPAGIPVASVTGVHTQSGARHETVSLRPMANLHALAFVRVVRWYPTP